MLEQNACLCIFILYLITIAFICFLIFIFNFFNFFLIEVHGNYSRLLLLLICTLTVASSYKFLQLFKNLSAVFYYIFRNSTGLFALSQCTLSAPNVKGDTQCDVSGFTLVHGSI